MLPPARPIGELCWCDRDLIKSRLQTRRFATILPARLSGGGLGRAPGGIGMAAAHKAQSAATPGGVAELDASPPELLGFYRDMLLIRRFEERAGQMYGMGLIGGFCHLYIGQEAVVVGMQAALKEGDTIVTSYRDHGHMLACGMDPKGVMAELTGRRDRLFARQGRLDAHVQPREEFFRRPRHRRRAGADRHRARLRPPLSRQRADLGHLSRRWRDQPGPGLRELQHGRAVEAAGHLCDREQPLRDGHLDRPRLGPHRSVPPRHGAMASPASRSTA